MAKSKAQRRAAKKARQAAKAAARSAGAPKPSKSALRKITRQTIKKASAPSNKQKTQNYIRKILSDGKVTKSEVTKAGNKGIKLDRITGAVTKAAQPGNPFSGAASSPVRFAGANKTRTTPAPAITITAGAQKLVDRDTARREAAKIAGISNTTPPPTTNNTAGAGTGTTDLVEENPLQGYLDDALGRISDLETQLAETPDFATLFAEQAERDRAQRQADADAARQQQALYMEEMAARSAEQERMRFLTSQTQQQNAARSGLGVDFRLGSRRDNLRMGTGGFKRRRRFRPETIAQGIAPTTPTAGVTNGNLLNV